MNYVIMLYSKSYQLLCWNPKIEQWEAQIRLTSSFSTYQEASDELDKIVTSPSEIVHIIMVSMI